jgi:hypothetical protein
MTGVAWVSILRAVARISAMMIAVMFMRAVEAARSFGHVGLIRGNITTRNRNFIMLTIKEPTKTPKARRRGFVA